MLDAGREYLTMAQAEGEFWWYRALHTLVEVAISAHPAGRDVRVLDAGCGTGGLLRFLTSRGYRHLSGFDVSPFAIEICRERGLPVRLGDLRNLATMLSPGEMDVIVSTDTLYFFPPEVQQQIVCGCLAALAPAGLLILNLPALSCFRGLHDQAVGIERRFSAADVPRLLLPAGFELVSTRYWPTLLSPLLLARRFTQRLRMAMRPGRATPRSDTRLPPRWLNEVLARITLYEIRNIASGPFASSLFVIARKPDLR